MNETIKAAFNVYVERNAGIDPDDLVAFLSFQRRMAVHMLKEESAKMKCKVQVYCDESNADGIKNKMAIQRAR